MGMVDYAGATVPMAELLAEPFAPKFPPTAAWWDRDVADAFAQTAYEPRRGEWWVLPLVLQGAQWEIGSADLILQPASAIPSGAFGNVSCVVVASDSHLKNYVRVVAMNSGAPIWISDSWSDYIHRAEPAGPLTESERETLEALRERGGEATASQIAEQLQLEPAAAGNRLAGLERKGFVFRQRRSKREGDLFLVPLFTEPSRPAAPPTPTNATAAVTLELPAAILDEVRRRAQAENISEEVLLARAWISYLNENKGEVAAQQKVLQDLGDDDYVRATSPDLSEAVDRLGGSNDPDL